MIGGIPWDVLLACCIARAAVEYHRADVADPPVFKHTWVLECRRWSWLLGLTALLATAAHLGFSTRWYWALLLIALTHIVGILGSLPYAVLVGRSRALPAAYLVWPACVLWANIAIHGLAQAGSTR
jgi:hypothetical protein